MGTVVRHAVDGWVLDIRDVETCVLKFKQLIKERELLKEFSKNALERANQHRKQDYGLRLLEALAVLENRKE